MLRWLFGDEYPTLRDAIVNTKRGGPSFRGVIWERRGGYLILRNAEMLKARGESIPIDGEALIPVADIEFVQLPRGGE